MWAKRSVPEAPLDCAAEVRVGNGEAAVAHRSLPRREKIRSHNHMVNRSWVAGRFRPHFVVDYVTRIFEKSVFTEIARDRQSGCGPAPRCSSSRAVQHH
jgi:hypothetical protein